MTDILINLDRGSLALLYPATDSGAEWCANNLDPDSIRFGCNYVVEPRYLADIVEGMIDDGLTVAPSNTAEEGN